MATLEKIRSKGGLLVLVIGLALLAFIVGDLLNSGATYFNSSRDNVAEIAGEDINIRDYQALVDQTMEIYKIEFNQANLNDEFQSQIRAMVWENLVNEKLLQAEAEKIGLTVSKEELSDRMIGNNIHPVIMQRPVFRGENGQFDRNIVLEFYGMMDQDPEIYGQQVLTIRNYMLYWEKVVKNSILQEKFNALISQSVTANNIDAKNAFDNRLLVADVQYITEPYYTVPDSAVSVSSNEIKDLYNKKKEQYKQEDSRSINYVSFEVKPLEADYTQIQEWMDKVSEEFKTTNDVVGFIRANSDVLYDGTYYSERTVPALLKEFAFNGKKGDFFGPVFHDDIHTMAKLMETGIMRPDSVKLRHIVLDPRDEARADSIVKVLRTDKNADFAALARQFSGVNTKENGGDLGWLTDGVKGVDRDFFQAFDKKAGDVFVVKKPQGIQIIQVVEKTRDIAKVKLAILERKVTASSRSQAQIFNEAKQFAAAVKTPEDFERLAAEQGVTVQSASKMDINMEKIGAVPQSRQIVKWAYGADLNEISDVFDSGEEFVVAVLTEINKKGYMPLENISSVLKAELVKEKKADYIVKNLNEKIASGLSLEQLAQQIGTDVKEVDNLTFSSASFDGSREPFVIAKAMNQELNTMSQAIKGNSGVYVVYPVNKVENTTEPFDAENEIRQLNTYYQYSLPYGVQEDINANGDVVDNRSNFY